MMQEEKQKGQGLMLALLGFVGVALGFALTIAVSDPTASDDKSDDEKSRSLNRSAVNSETWDSQSGERVVGPETTGSPSNVILSRLDDLFQNASTWSSARLRDEAGRAAKLPYPEFQIAQRLIFRAWGEVAPRDALAFLKEVETGDQSVLDEGMLFLQQFRGHLFAGWASRDPREASEIFLRFYPEAETARDWFDAQGDTSAGLVAVEWARRDPKAALDWVNSIDIVALRRLARERLFSELSRQDFEAAKRLVAESGNELWNSTLLEEIAKTDWAKAEQFYRSMEPDEDLTWVYVTALSKRDVAGAIEVISKQDEDIREDLWHEVTLAHPQGLLEFLDQNPDYREALDYEHLIKSLQTKYPEGAARVVVAQVVEGDQEWPEGFDPMTLFENWTGADAAGALRWVDRLPGGPLQQEAIWAFAATNLGATVEERIKTAERISNPESRAALIQSIRETDLLGFVN